MAEIKRSLETLEIVGGALCLDFVNTINSRHAPEHDYLMVYSELVNWGSKLGIVSAQQNSRLQKQAIREVEVTKNSLNKAREFRELLYRLFSSLAKQLKPNQADLAAFTQLYGEALSFSELVRTDENFIPIWQVDKSQDAMLWPIAHSAGQILLSNELVQLKECSGCGWLFLDTSKNQSRRWCSMNTCGARDKMRRYHGRLRGKA